VNLYMGGKTWKLRGVETESMKVKGMQMLRGIDEGVMKSHIC
jgi:hypothetical protein